MRADAPHEVTVLVAADRDLAIVRFFFVNDHFIISLEDPPVDEAQAADRRIALEINPVYLLDADPEARVADKVIPTLPISIMNVMDGMRGNQEMVVNGESNVDETATGPLDYVVSGAQLLTVTVK